MFQNLGKIYLLANECTDIEKISAANLLAFPNSVSIELYNDIFEPDENTISGILKTNTDFFIGFFIAKIIPGYQLIFIKDLVINPKLKSHTYGRDIVYYLGHMGLKIYNENFKGIVASSICKKSKKSLDDRNAYKLKSLVNAGGDLVVECARVKNNHLHFIYIPYNGGSESEEIKEVFRKLYKQ
jgi:hypothetical protein